MGHDGGGCPGTLEDQTPAHAHYYQAAAKQSERLVQLLTLDEVGHFELIAPWTEPGRRVVEWVVGEVKQLGSGWQVARPN